MAKIGGRLDYTGKAFTMSFYWGIRTTAADSYVSISARNGGTDVSDKYIVCTNDEVFCIYAENSQGTFYMGENVPDNLVGSNTGYSTVTGKIVCKNGDNITIISKRYATSSGIYTGATAKYLTHATVSVSKENIESGKLGAAGYMFYGWATRLYDNETITFRHGVGRDAEETLTVREEGGSPYYLVAPICVKPSLYKVTLFLNGGMAPSHDGSTVELEVPEIYGDYLPVPEREGYNFEGWLESENGAVKYKKDDLFIPDSDVTLYAKWSPNKYKVTFDENGGTGLVEYQREVTFGEIYNTFGSVSRTGYSFVGWTLTPNGEDFVYATDTVSIADNHTLYAKWKGISVTVTKKLIGDTSEGASDAVKDIGTLELYIRSTSSGEYELSDIEPVDGVLKYEGAAIAGTLENPAFKVECAMDGNSVDRFYEAKGLKTSSNAYNPTPKFTVAPSASSEPEELAKNDYAFEYWFKERPFYSLTTSANPTYGGTVSVVTSSDNDGKYVQGKKVRVEIKPNGGFKFSNAKLTYSGGSAADDFSSLDDGGIAFTVTDDITLTVNFERETYKITADIDEPSKDAIESVVVEGVDENYKASYDATVSYVASVKDGYLFDGWYDGDNKVSEDARYVHTVKGEFLLVAKAKVQINLALRYDSAEGDNTDTCSLTVNGGENPGPFFVVLGESFEYSLALGKRTTERPEIMVDDGMWYLNGWFSDPDDATTVQNFAQSGMITPTRALNLTAVVASYGKATKSISVMVGKITFDGDSKTFTPVESSGAITFSKGKPPTGMQGGAGEIEPYKHNITGVSYVTVTAALSLPDGDAFNGFTDADGNELTKEREYTVLLVSDLSLHACYGLPSKVVTSIDYASGSNETMGEFSVVGASDKDAVIAEDFKSVESLQGTTVRVMAVAKNGYRFAGWYTSSSGNGTPIDENPDAELPVTVQRTIYAKFEQDPRAIYEWEGGKDFKAVEWVSKTYVSSTPINFGACRVDATGYRPNSMADLTVSAFSSPETAASASVKLSNIASQGARRLPVMRKEKFTQVKIEANVEIDTLVVSTSMGGLVV